MVFMNPSHHCFHYKTPPSSSGEHNEPRRLMGLTQPEHLQGIECAKQTKQMVDCSHYKKLPPGQQRFCHHMYDPICGSDGKTYKNDCFFCSKVKKTDGTLKFVHFGKC
ncbi:serine peptidase inhibitor Kazal type 9 [Homo sapiens]|uniref:Serine peptidase inhibitor Kazal type 9 n=1 Tax=Homo sapiens TaxID=9606 RepID=D6RJC5_HUMAN|nr:serine protease inhibitor Kazal-type 9 isoform X1 [Homo sapiens]XP_054209072.1 serine protease inhibitor Kazal-type 9 isoform X1 [Homo sapiens]KAI4023350.1 serine peptidase inhibitor Kazal type 9 [Homo sapiens]|eukprot:XP_016865198.1 serine protease inhibitor Kazal-type 9 isoform X1 [Homo sapiens]